MYNIEGNMHKINQYLFYGIDNKEELIEAIIYYAGKESKGAYASLKDLYKRSKSEHLDRLKNVAISKYRQFYRFVDLNDKVNSFKYDVEKDVLENELSRVIARMLEEKEIGPQIKYREMMITKAGIYFSRSAEDRFYRSIWTKELYDILTGLEELESEDKLKYYGLWLKTKKERALGRKNEEELKNIELAEKLYQERQNKIKEYNKNGYEH